MRSWRPRHLGTCASLPQPFARDGRLAWEHEVEAVSAVIALQHADWLGLAIGVVRRGPGNALDPELVQADVDRLDDVEGEIEDPEGHLAVLDAALLHLTPLWKRLDVLDAQDQLTERGVWGLPKALNRIWGHADQPPGPRQASSRS
jgi:hypothetical protein